MSVVRARALTAFFIGSVTFIFVLLADQLSKSWVLHGLSLPEKGSVRVCAFLNFTMVWNKAVTFGMFSGVMGRFAPLVFACLAAVIVIALLGWMYKTQRWWTGFALGGIAGGATGNILDRLHYGAVVDFIHLHIAGWSWYVFNFADSAIVCGVIILLIDTLLDHNKGSGAAS